MTPIEIIQIGITDIEVDCVVNAANEGLLPGGGVCGAIFREAGYEQLTLACNKIGHCDTGRAVITQAFKLKAFYVIHVVGPRWNGGKWGEEKQLYDCYQSALRLAADNACDSIAFPLISAGIYGYPQTEAWRVAIRSILDYQQEHTDCKMSIFFTIPDPEIYLLGKKVYESTMKERGF